MTKTETTLSLTLGLMDELVQKAIEEALKGNWEEARDLNKQILKQDPKSEEALNRLARASFELGDLQKSTFYYRKVLRLDPYNAIAQKALVRLGKAKRPKKSVLKSKLRKEGGLSPILTATQFIEESGKTRAVSLIHLGDNSVINSLTAGEEVRLVPHAHRVSAQTRYGKYVGRLPDDLSRRIIKLARAGNEYKSLVKSSSPGNVKIFIREVKRAPSLGNIPSFPINERPGHFASSPTVENESN